VQRTLFSSPAFRVCRRVEYAAAVFEGQSLGVLLRPNGPQHRSCPSRHAIDHAVFGA
jgi:hypothetical protein